MRHVNLVSVLLIMLTGCHKTMPPIYGGMYHPDSAQPGTVDVHTSGSAIKRMRSVSLLTAPGAGRNIWAGALNITPKVTQSLAVPLETQISPTGLGKPGYDVVTRVGARFILKCSDPSITCDDRQRASNTIFAAGFGGGPNVQVEESSRGYLMKGYGWNVDFEVGVTRRLNDLSVHWLSRFGYYNNQATASSLWLTALTGIGFHPFTSHTISLDARAGFGTVLESKEKYLIEMVQDLGAQLTWSIRFGASESPQ